MNKNFKKTIKAFSLIELSIVILIVSILIAGSIGVSKTAINNSKNKITKERMDSVYNALSNFIATNRRLPCPALPNVAKGASTYGEEAATPGTCTGFTVATSTNLIYGMLPLQALGLEPDMGEDGFGTKFSYVVDKRFTRTNIGTTDTTDGFELAKANKAEDGVAISPSLIDIQGPSGTSIAPDLNAIFVLISHGANKFNGWNASGTAQNGTSTSSDENSNSGSYSGGGTFNNNFIAYSTETVSGAVVFDDIVIFKTKNQLVKDAGLEFIMCNGFEAKNSTYDWGTSLATLKNGSYGCSASSNAVSTLCVQKTCGKYGIWGAAGSAAVANCGITCS